MANVRQQHRVRTRHYSELSRRRFLQWGLSLPAWNGLSGCGGSGSDKLLNLSSEDIVDDGLSEDNTPQEAPLPEAALFGLFELIFSVEALSANPFLDTELQVVFTDPDQNDYIVDAFYDDNLEFKARAYCNRTGVWRWQSTSNIDALNELSGGFLVVPSALPGKLRLHPDDNRQFITDDGQWFLHIGDTAYRYFSDTEPLWQEYIDQAYQFGFNKVRVWFNRNRYDIQVLFDNTRQGFNLPYWQHIESRLNYALENYPGIQLQVILYSEDTAEIRRYGTGDSISRVMGKYAQARFSAYPNVHWCLTNDRVIYYEGEDTSGFPDHKIVRLVLDTTVDAMGADHYQREPWDTLITNHQSRFDGYDFHAADWSSMNLLSDEDEVSGELIQTYYKLNNKPSILSEDRYEYYAAPAHPRYYFRRMLWSSLLSGGHATYGGIRSYDHYDGYNGGVQGYIRLSEEGRLEGANDFPHVIRFFAETGIELVGMTPADNLVGDTPGLYKCIRDDSYTIIYLANPDNSTIRDADVSNSIPELTLTGVDSLSSALWFDPRSGAFSDSLIDSLDNSVFTAPGPGDWVLLLST